jgi:hypothetical protein
VLGTGITLRVFIMWWLVVIPTLHGFWKGTLFEAPCLATIPENYRQNVLKCPQTQPGNHFQKKAASPDVMGCLH